MNKKDDINGVNIYGVDTYEVKNKNTEEPSWVLQRHPNPTKGHTYIQIWFKHDAIEVTSVELAQMLADVLKNQVTK